MEAVLLGYQGRWVADDSAVKFGEKSRRVGLTWAEASDDVLIAAAQNGQDVWYIGYNKDMAQEFIIACSNWVKAYKSAASEIIEEDFIDSEDKSILSYKINFSSGKRITALSSRPSNLRGKQGIVVIDEAAFHDDLDELLKAAIALLMWGGKVRILSTHNGVENAFNELLQEVLSGKKPYSHHKITLDDALEDGLYKRICEKTNQKWTPEAEHAWRDELVAFYGDSADEELFCIAKDSAGAYLKRVHIENCMIEAPIIHIKLDDDFAMKADAERAALTEFWCITNLQPLIAKLTSLKTYIGVDFARSSDLSVFAVAQEQQDLTLKTVFMLELRNVPFTDQEQIFKYIAGNVPRFTAAALDSRANGEYLGERATQAYGSRAGAVMISAKWYAETMPKLKSAIEDREILIPKDADVLDDLRAIEVVNGVPSIPKIRKKSRKDTGDRHGDAAVAIAMLIHACKAMDIPADVEYEQVQQRDSEVKFNKGGW